MSPYGMKLKAHRKLKCERRKMTSCVHCGLAFEAARWIRDNSGQVLSMEHKAAVVVLDRHVDIFQHFNQEDKDAILRVYNKRRHHPELFTLDRTAATIARSVSEKNDAATTAYKYAQMILRRLIRGHRINDVEMRNLCSFVP